MSIHVRRELRGAYKGHSEVFVRWYGDAQGLHLYEQHAVQRESDFCNGMTRRESFDNGRSFGEPHNVYGNTFETVGEQDEIMYYDFEPNRCDPVSGNQVTCGLMRYYVGGHIEADRLYWDEGKTDESDHAYLVYRRPDGSLHRQQIVYEDGADYDPENPRNPDFLEKNRSFFGVIQPASNGDLLIPVGVNMRACCRILGQDVNEIFPSCPDIMCGVCLFRAHWSQTKQTYELSHSKPVSIGDTLSSRGICEPCVCELKSGRIVIVFRGSNMTRENWHTRIDPATPGFKWYIFSDDGGKTFTQPMPWYFDTREVVYSSSTISYFFRSSQNGKAYWIGNITAPQNIVGNYPRYPLQICQVDEQYGHLIKDTLTEIDTRREGESEVVELSNFSLLENRETGKLEVRLTKFGMDGNPALTSDSEAWTYYIDLGE